MIANISPALGELDLKDNNNYASTIIIVQHVVQSQREKFDIFIAKSYQLKHDAIYHGEDNQSNFMSSNLKQLGLFITVIN